MIIRFREAILLPLTPIKKNFCSENSTGKGFSEQLWFNGKVILGKNPE